MPNVSNTIRRQLNVNEFKLSYDPATATYDSDNIKPSSFSFPKFVDKFACYLREGHKIGKIEPLFKRITDDETKLWREKFGGQQAKDAAAAAAAAKDKKKDKKSSSQQNKESKKGKESISEKKSSEETPKEAPKMATQ